ncbi:MAG: hypothetical protein OXR73_10690, partial [Myxococcales bacterium]|nr:hypothetical protein [Myxococcales bacterium]
MIAVLLAGAATTVASGWTLKEVASLVAVATAGVKVAQWAWGQWQVRRGAAQAGARLFGREALQEVRAHYIRPNCSAIDPTNEVEVQQGVRIERPLFEVVDEHLAKQSPYLLVLADSGMGKTAFAINYYLKGLGFRMRPRAAVVPLGDPKAKEEIDTIRQQLDPKDTVLILDAFDEYPGAVGDHEKGLRELMECSQGFRRVIVTCRTQFFPREEDQPRDSHVLRVGPRKLGDGTTYEFRKLFLSVFDERLIGRFLRRRYPLWDIRLWSDRRRAKELVQRVPKLAPRPMLLAHVPEVLARDSGEPSTAYDLYDQMVEGWIDREAGTSGLSVDPDQLRKFSEQLAVLLWC